MSREDAVTEWKTFWLPIFEDKDELTEDGRPTLEAIQNELSDYRMLLDFIPQVYSEITGGMLSKPNYLPSVVVSAAEEYFDRVIREDIAEELLYCDYDEVQEWISENLHKRVDK